MANINTTQTVYLYTALNGGIQPYDQCARWAGGWTANNGYTGTLKVGPNLPPTPNVPYIDSNNTPCAIPGTDGGSLTGTLMPNGFTGDIGVWVEAADSEGIFGESNHKFYTVVPLTGVLAYAGLDQTITGVGPSIVSFNGATASGGTPPYTYEWSQSLSNPYNLNTFSPNAFALNPNVTGFYTDGNYTFTLKVTDSIGQTGADSLNVAVSGSTPPTIPFNVYWDNSIGTAGAGRSSTIKMWHKPASSVTWNSPGLSNTSTSTSSNTGTVLLQLEDPAGDQIRVAVSGTNYKNCEIFGEEFGSYTSITGWETSAPATPSSFTVETYVNSIDYVNYKVYTWTDYSSCLGAGSLVKLANGSEIKVEDLCLGDSLASLNIANSESWRNFSSLEFTPDLTTTKVSAITSFAHETYVQINKDFNVSESHPLFIFRDNTYTFVEAKVLLLTDKLISETGEFVNITSIDLINEPITVYSISTDPSHIYIANGVINHNKKASLDPIVDIIP